MSGKSGASWVICPCSAGQENREEYVLLIRGQGNMHIATDIIDILPTRDGLWETRGLGHLRGAPTEDWEGRDCFRPLLHIQDRGPSTQSDTSELPK